MRKFFISLLVSFTMLCSLNAQELICNVTVNSDKISGTNKQIFQSLEKSIKEYMNGQSWTDFVFDSNERIDCSFFITVKIAKFFLFAKKIRIYTPFIMQIVMVLMRM